MNIATASKGTVIPSPGPGVVFTAPSGVITVVSCILVTARNVISTVNIRWNSGIGTGGLSVRLFPNNLVLPANGSAQEVFDLYLYPLDTIEADSTDAGTHMIISAKALG